MVLGARKIRVVSFWQLHEIISNTTLGQVIVVQEINDFFSDAILQLLVFCVGFSL